MNEIVRNQFDNHLLVEMVLLVDYFLLCTVLRLSEDYMFFKCNVTLCEGNLVPRNVNVDVVEKKAKLKELNNIISDRSEA